MKINNRRMLIFVLVVFAVLIVAGLTAFSLRFKNDISHPLRGEVTHVEQGKDGLQVELQTEDQLYNVTISVIRAEIVGPYEQIQIGTSIEVTGQMIADIEPPLIVADRVKVLGKAE